MRWLLLLILLPAVAALGIAPADSVIDLSELQKIQFRVYNTEGKTQDVVLSANGTLAEYLSFDQVIKLAPDERVKQFTIEVAPPEKPGSYKATITAEAGSSVKATISGTVKGSMPTGMVVAEDEGGRGYIWPALLVLIIVANIFFLASRKTTTSPAEKALRKLRRMDHARFSKAVNSSQNIIADDLEQSAPELAFRIYDITSKRQMEHEIQAYIEKKPHHKTKEELAKEIRELKHELDTFDFSGFEDNMKQ